MPGYYLIAYDVTHPGRLRKVHKLLSQLALPVQYSVFLCQADRQQILHLMKRIAMLVDEAEDDVRAYPVRWPQNFLTYGRDASMASEAFWSTGA